MGANQDLATLVQLIENEQRALQRDQALLGEFDRRAATQLAELRVESFEGLANALKVATADEDKGKDLLARVLADVNRGRIRHLHGSLQTLVARLHRRVNSPWSMGVPLELVDEVATLRQAVEEFDASAHVSPGSVLTNHLEDLQALLRKLDHARKKARIRVPLMVFLWGLPVWIGFVLSGRATVQIGAASLILLLVITGAVYLVARRHPFGDRRMQAVRRFVPSSRVLQRVIVMGSATVMMILVTVTMMAEARGDLVAVFSRDVARLEVTDTVEVTTGNTVFVPLTIRTEGPTLYRVKVSLSSPLFTSAISADDLSAVWDRPARAVLTAAVAHDSPIGTHPARITVKYQRTSPVPWLYSGEIEKSLTRAMTIWIRR